jgi:hypothetical protein
VPGATVTLAGWKFSDWSEPTFWGMTMVSAPPEAGAELDTAVVVEVGVLVDVVVVVVELGVVVLVAVVTAVEEELDVAALVVEVTAVVVDVAVVEAEEEAVVVAVLVELAVIVGLPAPFVVHHMVVHVDEEAAAVVVQVAALDAEVVVDGNVVHAIACQFECPDWVGAVVGRPV